MTERNWKELFQEPDQLIAMLESLEQDVANGGSSAVKVVRVPITFDTPDLVLTGITIYVPTPGDVMATGAAVVMFISTAWDGMTPSLHWGTPGDPTLYSEGSPSVIGAVDLTQEDVLTGGLAQSQITDSPNGSLEFKDTTPLVVMVDDFAGNDPGSTQGAGEIILTILTAS